MREKKKLRQVDLVAVLHPSAKCAPLTADVPSFNEMRLPEPECWQCLPMQSPVWTRLRSHRVGRLWPRSCLPRSPINSNCLLQLFSGTMSDVFLLFWPASDAKQTFYHADKGQKGERLKGRPWMGWPNGWQKCGRGESIEVLFFFFFLHLQNGFLKASLRSPDTNY